MHVDFKIYELKSVITKYVYNYKCGFAGAYRMQFSDVITAAIAIMRLLISKTVLQNHPTMHPIALTIYADGAAIAVSCAIIFLSHQTQLI